MVLNLIAHPQVQVGLGGITRSYLARQTSGAEREACWRLAASLYAGFEAYRRRARGREIPVVVLTSLPQQMEGEKGQGDSPLSIATGSMDAAHLRLVRDYQAWQAPWLLLLPHLDEDTRSGLESCACQQAESIEKHCRLYPEVVNRSAIQAARVEAALMRNQPPHAKPAVGMSLLHIGLNVSEGE